MSDPSQQLIDIVSDLQETNGNLLVAATTAVNKANNAVDEITTDFAATNGATMIGTPSGDSVQVALDQRAIYVDTFDQLASIPLSRLANNRVVIVGTGLRAGVFYYTTTNISARVSRDPGQGLFIPRTGDLTGTTGGFVRDYHGGDMQAVWFGVDPTVGVDNTTAIRNAIYGATLYIPTDRQKNAAVVFPLGRTEFNQNNLLGAMNFITQGGTFSNMSGLLLKGQGRQSSELYCITGGSEKWLYDSQSTGAERMSDVNFVDLAIRSDNPENFNFCRMLSLGNDKRFRLTRCNLICGTAWALYGAANADLHRATDSSIEVYRSLVEFHNNQAVSIEFNNCDIQVYRDLVLLGSEGGGSFRHIGGNCEMQPHPTDTVTDHFLFKWIGAAGLSGSGLGNCDFITQNVRFEIHGNNKKVFKMDTYSNSRPIKYDMVRCEFGTVEPASRQSVLVNNHNTVVTFDSCILNDLMTFQATADTADGTGASNTPQGAVIRFRDCCTGTGTTRFHTRCTTTGNRARIVSNGSYAFPSAVNSNNVCEDFDKGWISGEYQNKAGTPKIISMAYNGNTIAINNTLKGVLRVPTGCFLRKVTVTKTAGTGTEAYQLRLGNFATNTILASSVLSTVSGVHTILLEESAAYGFDELNVWAETTATAASQVRCIVEYI